MEFWLQGILFFKFVSIPVWKILVYSLKLEDKAVEIEKIDSN